MPLRLEFKRDPAYKPSLTDRQYGWPFPDGFEGRTATDVLDQWQASTGWTADPLEFRQRLLRYSGADSKRYLDHPVRLPALDHEILLGVVEASGPERMKLIGQEEPPTAEEAARWPAGY
jgi:hypothetical protein